MIEISAAMNVLQLAVHPFPPNFMVWVWRTFKSFYIHHELIEPDRLFVHLIIESIRRRNYLFRLFWLLSIFQTADAYLLWPSFLSCFLSLPVDFLKYISIKCEWSPSSALFYIDSCNWQQSQRLETFSLVARIFNYHLYHLKTLQT